MAARRAAPGGQAIALTAEVVRARFIYEPETGAFIWRSGIKWRRAGTRAGYLREDGRIDISVCNRQWRAHRLAWLYMTGDWPHGEIDHINRDPADNRWANLRLATSAQNKYNASAHRDGRSGSKGVTWDKSRGKYIASIFQNGHRRHLGRFASVAEASAAYRVAEVAMRGTFARRAV